MSEGAIDTSGIIDKALLRKARSNLGGASLITFIRRQTRSKVWERFASFFYTYLRFFAVAVNLFAFSFQSILVLDIINQVGWLYDNE